jgi:undecaprenyl-diphosphatase
MVGHRLLSWFSHYGYLGLALGVFLESAGLPLPGETALLAAAFASAGGALRLPLVILVAAIASILGDNLGYFVGRRLGRGWLERHGHQVLLTPRRLRRMDRFFDRFGAAAIAIARFVAGVRVIAAISAGIAHVPWRKFVLFNVLGAVAWAVAIGGLGYAAGRGWSTVPHPGARLGLGIAAVVAAVVVLGLLFRRLRGPGEALWRTEWLRDLVWEWVGVLAVSLTAVLLVAKVTEDVAEHESTAFDSAIRAFAAAHHSQFLDGLFRAVTRIGAPSTMVPLALLLAGLLWWKTRKRYLVAVVVAPLIGTGFFLALKAIFPRPRPAGAQLVHLLTYSFPSGHATVSSAVVFTLAYVLARERLVRALPAALVALVYVLAVGISRVYLDLHWATDVLGGWAVGLFVATLSAAFYERLRDEPLPFLWHSTATETRASGRSVPADGHPE